MLRSKLTREEILTRRVFLLWASRITSSFSGNVMSALAGLLDADQIEAGSKL